MSEKDKYRPVKGWAEILHYKPKIPLDQVHPIENFTDVAKYKVAGSWLPLEEYVLTFDILRHMAGDVSELYGVDRPLRAFDAITLCIMERPAIKSRLVVPKHLVPFYKFPNANPQFQADNELALINLPTHLDSFRYPGWPWRYMASPDE